MGRLNLKSLNFMSKYPCTTKIDEAANFEGNNISSAKFDKFTFLKETGTTL